ncbi:putative gag-pol polyprotein, partial [Gregarina niphandrodes]
GAHEDAYNQLRRAVRQTVTLYAPTPSGEYVIETDASELGVGAVLKQVQEGTEVPIEFASKKFNPTESRWDTRERELFAVKWAVEKWRDYVGLAHFTVRTDHNNLRYLTNVDKGKVFRWALALSNYDFTIEFISGETNNIADWLSRYAGDDREEDELLDRMSLQVAAVRAPMLNLPQPPTKEDFVRAYAEEGKPDLPGLHYDGLWWIHLRTQKIYVPRQLRTRIVIAFHYGPSGHLGVGKTRKRVQALYYWPGCAQDIERMIRECLICRRLKTPPAHQQGLPTGTLGKAAAMDVVSLDHVGPIHMGGIGWNILVIIDHATRYMMAKVVPTLAAVQTFSTFYRHWVVPFGPPRIVLTDNGTSFKGAFHVSTTYQLGCKHLTAAPYRPQGTGLTRHPTKSSRTCSKRSGKKESETWTSW